jgi:hypothetical protein
MDATSVSGKCLCGSIVFQYTGEPNWTLHCHCESCRRATSSPITTWISVPRRAFAFTKGAPRYFHSSPGVRRGLLRELWVTLTYENERIEREFTYMRLSLLDPNYASPRCHVFVVNSYPGSRRSMTCRGLQRPVATVPRLSAAVPGRNWIDLSCRGHRPTSEMKRGPPTESGLLRILA